MHDIAFGFWILGTVFHQIKPTSGPYFYRVKGSINHAVIDWILSKGWHDKVLIGRVHNCCIIAGIVILIVV